MFLSHLALTHFRNYRDLSLDFTQPITLIQGENAQGKSNLMEAIYLLATSKPVHAQTEREVVGWSVDEAPIPHSRIEATVMADVPSSAITSTADLKPLRIEILFSPAIQSKGYKKQIKINGINRRALDLVGKMRAVLFLPEDIKLVAGSPSERRRYLDIALCQMDRNYTSALSRYQKVLSQRNSLLKSLREHQGSLTVGSTQTQLQFWDEQLVDFGSQIVTARAALVSDLILPVRQRHSQLSNERESLTLAYVPSFNPGILSDQEYTLLKEAPDQLLTSTEHSQADGKLSIGRSLQLSHKQVVDAFLTRLDHRRTAELAAGVTLYGPHRDDLAFVINQRDLRTYGSRGQQRTAALSLKLAEVQVMAERTGESPILLLDDVMSELDVKRRDMLLDALSGIKQSVITTTDWNDFAPEFLAKSARLTVSNGTVQEIRGDGR